LAKDISIRANQYGMPTIILAREGAAAVEQAGVSDNMFRQAM
jgi:hypothetical protein